MLRQLLLACFTLALAAAHRGAAADKEPAAPLKVDKDKGLVILEAKIAPRKIDDPRFKEIYPIEVIACYPFPRGQKAHETVVTIEAKPSDIHKALTDLGLKAGTPAVGESKDPPKGPEVKIFLEFPGADGEVKRVAIEKTLIDPKTNKNLPPLKWRFTGSAMKQPDPNKDDKVYGADLSGTLISIFPVTNETVFQTNLTMKEEKYVKLETDKKVLPKEGTPVKLVIEVPQGK